MMIKDNGLYLGAHGGEGQWASQERLWSADSLSSAPPPRDILLAGRNVRHAWRCLAPLQPRTRGRLGARRRCGSGRAPAEKQVHPRRRFQRRTRCCCLLRGRRGHASRTSASSYQEPARAWSAYKPRATSLGALSPPAIGSTLQHEPGTPQWRWRGCRVQPAAPPVSAVLRRRAVR